MLKEGKIIPIAIVGDAAWVLECSNKLGQTSLFQINTCSSILELVSKIKRGCINYILISPSELPKNKTELQHIGLSFPLCKFLTKKGSFIDLECGQHRFLLGVDFETCVSSAIVKMALVDGGMHEGYVQDYYSYRNYIAGKIIHDLNNRFLSISGGLQMLKMQHTSDSAVSKNVDRIKSQNDGAVDLALQLRQLNERQFSKELGPWVFDTLRDCLGYFSVRNPGQTIRIEVGDDVNVIIDNIDHRYLWVALSILLENAAESIESAPGGEITLFIKKINSNPSKECLFGEYQGGDYLEIVICDSGVGLPVEDPGLLFNPEFTTKGDGHGYSLSAVRDFSRREGRYLYVEVHNTQPKTTCFTLGIPYKGSS